MKTGSTMYVTFWGTRGSISTPGSQTEKYGGNTPCVSVRYDDTTVIYPATAMTRCWVPSVRRSPSGANGAAKHLEGPDPAQIRAYPAT